MTTYRKSQTHTASSTAANAVMVAAID